MPAIGRKRNRAYRKHYNRSTYNYNKMTSPPNCYIQTIHIFNGVRDLLWNLFSPFRTYKAFGARCHCTPFHKFLDPPRYRLVRYVRITRLFKEQDGTHRVCRLSSSQGHFFDSKHMSLVLSEPRPADKCSAWNSLFAIFCFCMIHMHDILLKCIYSLLYDILYHNIIFNKKLFCGSMCFV